LLRHRPPHQLGRHALPARHRSIQKAVKVPSPKSQVQSLKSNIQCPQAQASVFGHWTWDFEQFLPTAFFPVPRWPVILTCKQGGAENATAQRGWTYNGRRGRFRGAEIDYARILIRAREPFGGAKRWACGAV